MIYKAFVSSTFEDLKAHRAHVIKALRKAGFFVDPMEDWAASSDEPKQFSQTRIEGCNVCVLLVGFRRGHVPEHEQLSITQLEYKAAQELGIDILVFMLDEQAPWPRRFDELNKDPEISHWRVELMERKGVGFFGLEPESIEIAPALTRWLAEQSTRKLVGIQQHHSFPLAIIDREILRFGLSLGWQLGRYELVYDSPFPEARAIQADIEGDIATLLLHDGFPYQIEGLDYQQLIGKVLSYYGTTAVEKHAVILLGIAAMRTSLVGASKEEGHNSEMAKLAFSALQEIDPRVLPDKNEFFQALLQRQPKSLVEVLELIESVNQSKQDKT